VIHSSNAVSTEIRSMGTATGPSSFCGLPTFFQESVTFFPFMHFITRIAPDSLALCLGYVAFLSVFGLCLDDTNAEPYLAVRLGYKCSQCHFNPTGGGKRNRFGTIFSQTEMPNRVVSAHDINRFLSLSRSWSDDGDEATNADATAEVKNASPVESTFYSGYLTKFLSVGGDFRLNYRATLNNAGGDSNTFDTTQGTLYGSLEVLEGVLSFYLDEKVAPGGAISREIFGLVRGPWNSHLKAGRMFLPFGLRLQDDTAFIREITGFNFGVQDVGVEVGIEPGPWSMNVAVSNGSQGSADDNKDKQVTGSVSFVQRYWRLGAHATWNNTSAAKRIAVGSFAGLNLGGIDVGGIQLERVTLLGEIDQIIDEFKIGSRRRQLLLYGALNYELLKGVNLKFAYDFADPDLSISDNSFVRASAGVEYTVTQFTQLRAFYRFRDETRNSPRDGESMLDFEIHVFF
jgi:hypothetical protein